MGWWESWGAKSMQAFRFEIGQKVRVLTHPAQPPGIVVARWRGEELSDPYRENIYEVSSFVTKQRESSLTATLSS